MQVILWFEAHAKAASLLSFRHMLRHPASLSPSKKDHMHQHRSERGLRRTNG
jgi:hypothetical protein